VFPVCFFATGVHVNNNSMALFFQIEIISRAKTKFNYSTNERFQSI